MRRSSIPWVRVIVMAAAVNTSCSMKQDAPGPAEADEDACSVQYAPAPGRTHLSDLGLSTYPFDFRIPKNTSIRIWVEAYRDGVQLDQFEPLALSSGQHTDGKRPWAGGFRFSYYDPQYTEEARSVRKRWILHFDGTTSSGLWLDDVFAQPAPNEIQYSWSRPKKERQVVELGKTYILMDITGRRRGANGTVVMRNRESEEEMKELAFCLLLKVMVEPFDPNVSPAGSTRSGREIPPKTPEPESVF